MNWKKKLYNIKIIEYLNRLHFVNFNLKMQFWLYKKNTNLIWKTAISKELNIFILNHFNVNYFY